MQNSLLADNVDHFSQDPAGTLQAPAGDAYAAGGVAGVVGTTGAVTVTVVEPE